VARASRKVARSVVRLYEPRRARGDKGPGFVGKTVLVKRMKVRKRP
jgi:hypothetical protein